MNAFLAERTPRERKALALLAAVLAALAVWQMALAPLLTWRADMERRRQTAETTYRLVSEAAAMAGAYGAAPDATPVRTALRDLALTHAVALTFINERGDGGVETQIATADPEALYALIADLERRHGARVVSADIARPDPARAEVRALLVFARGALR